jgi:uncharacterized lipoprotein YbaY
MMRKRVVIGVLILVAVTGCRRDGSPTTPDADQPTAPAVATPGPVGTDVAPMPTERTEPATIRISGEVFLRERIALPGDARLEVRLLAFDSDVATGREIAAVRLPTRRRPPIPFEMIVAEEDVAAGVSHAVTATISRRGAVAFTIDSPLPVLEPDAPTTGLRLLLRRPR